MVQEQTQIIKVALYPLNRLMQGQFLYFTEMQNKQ